VVDRLRPHPLLTDVRARRRRAIAAGQEPSQANWELRVVELSTDSDKTPMQQAAVAVAVGSC
jgi:hypothetical protein